MTRLFLLLALLLLALSGCGSVLDSVMNQVSDTIECHNKCPGASPEAEKKCFDECKQRLACERSQREEGSRKADAEREKFEWERKNEERFRILEHRHPLQAPR